MAPPFSVPPSGQLGVSVAAAPGVSKEAEVSSIVRWGPRARTVDELQRDLRFRALDFCIICVFICCAWFLYFRWKFFIMAQAVRRGRTGLGHGRRRCRALYGGGLVPAP